MTALEEYRQTHYEEGQARMGIIRRLLANPYIQEAERALYRQRLEDLHRVMETLRAEWE
jgi:hypothetical protein